MHAICRPVKKALENRAFSLKNGTKRAEIATKWPFSIQF
jgi:hypothetical protein